MVALKTCVVCDSKLETGSDFRKHQAEHVAGGEVVFSSDPREFVKTQCGLCDRQMTLGALR